MTPRYRIDRAQINKANAQHSTGPKTAEGKQRSSLNALRHGLTGQVVVMPAEDLAAYQRHLARYASELHPVGVIEEDLVHALAECTWRLNRVCALETNLHTMGVTIQSPIANAPEPVQEAFSVAASLQSQAKALANLSLHSQRLSRQYEKTRIQLRELQEARRAQEQHDLNDLLNIMQMHKDKGETYNASEDGFVFSDVQIAEAQRTRRREQLAEEAYEHCLEAAA